MIWGKKKGKRRGLEFYIYIYIYIYIGHVFEWGREDVRICLVL